MLKIPVDGVVMMRQKFGYLGRTRKTGNIIALTLLLISVAALLSLFALDSLYSTQLTETGLKIDTAEQVTSHIETLSDNITTIEQDVEAFNPVPMELVELNLKLVDLIEKGTASAGLDIEYRYIARLRNYHKDLSAYDSSDFGSRGDAGKPHFGGANDSTVDDALYQSFSGTQRSLEIMHEQKANLLNDLTGINTYKKAGLISTAVFMILYVMLTIAGFLRKPGHNTPEFIPSTESEKDRLIAS